MENINIFNQSHTYDQPDIFRSALSAILSHSSDMIFIKDINLTYLTASMPFVRMVGKQTLPEIVGFTDFQIFDNPELAKRYNDDDKRLLEGDSDLINYVEPLTDDNGQPRYCSTSKYILRNENGEPIGILGVSRDITGEYNARRRLQQELNYLFELPHDTYAALFMDIDDWRIISHQRRIEGEYVLEICETMADFAENAIRNMADPSDHDTLEFYRNLSRSSMLALSNSGIRTHSLEYLRTMPNESSIWVHIDIHFLVDPKNGHQCAIWTMRDIHHQKQETLNLHIAAEQDEMTGLLNRAAANRYIRQYLDSAADNHHALFFLDVDNFKSLNDTLGHQEGDRFLTMLAQSLKNCFRDYDIIGRVGGDEFFILMKNVPSSEIVSAKASLLLEACRKTCAGYPGLNLSVSIGIAMYPLNGRDIQTLYANADKALYRAKNSGKNAYSFAEEVHS